MKPFIPAMLVAIVGLPGCSSRSPSLPEASEVQGIKVIDSRDKTTHVIPADHVPAILALFRSGSRDHQPAKWQIMGSDLEIITVTGKRINIWLFKTFAGEGAFAIGPTWEERNYYRGSTDGEIAATIEKARNALKKED